jgi:uncharacterized protein
MNPVNWFEIPAKDLNRAKAFYEHVLGVELSVNDMGPLKMAWFPMGRDQPGAAGTLVQAEGYVPSRTGTVVYFSVPDIEAALKRAAEKGGSVLMAKNSIGEYGFIGQFEDREGNRVAVHAMT